MTTSFYFNDAAASVDQVRRTATLHQGQMDIDRRLADVDISLPEVATALKVSPRSLSDLFGEPQTLYRSFLCEQRLARCGRNLFDPRLAPRSVTAIVLSQRFIDPSRQPDFQGALWTFTTRLLRNGNGRTAFSRRASWTDRTTAMPQARFRSGVWHARSGKWARGPRATMRLSIVTHEHAGH
jgi:AraC-like DNA-binding protein